MRNAMRLLLALTTVIVAAACDDASTVQLLQIDATGQVRGVAYLDINGNGAPDTGDEPLDDLPVVLTAAGGGQVVEQVRTDATGLFVMPDVPVGSYRIDLAEGALGDSLQATGLGTEVEIERGDTARAEFAATYPVLTLAEVREATPGQRVFTSGIALNPRVNFGDGLVHLKAGPVHLRALNVARVNLNTGDSLRVLGRVRIDEGQPVLDDVTPFVLIPTATIPIPIELKTGEALTARNGALDAALVRVRATTITDTATTVDGDFRFRVDDGTGTVDVLVRSFLQLNNASIRPDTILRINRLTGLLVPDVLASGETEWRIYPRAGTDIVLEVKQADLELTASAQPTRVVKGDTITFTVVLRNGGPLAASGVQVRDSLPATLDLVEQRTSRGTYAPETGLWELDSLSVGRSDTLTLVGTVTTDQLGTDVNRARIVRLLNEVDPVQGNNLAQAPFTIEQRLSDIGLRVLANPSSAAQGDTIDFTVIADNSGPREALGVQVTDSIPFGVSFVEATPSQGTYDSGSFVWDIGEIPAGEADTLTVRTEVTTALTGSVVYRARLTRLEDGADTNAFNNQAEIIFTLVAPSPVPVPVRIPRPR